MAEKVAVPAAGVEVPSVFVCTPIKEFKLGEYQFHNGRLEFTDAKAAQKFEEFLAGLAPQTRGMVKQVSLEVAEKLASTFLSKDATAISGVATSDSMRAAAKIAEDQDTAKRNAASLAAAVAAATAQN